MLLHIALVSSTKEVSLAQLALRLERILVQSTVFLIDRGCSNRAVCGCATEAAMTGIRTFGIDISSYSGKIDWQKIKNRPLHFVLARASYISFKHGKFSEQKDSMFSSYWPALAG